VVKDVEVFVYEAFEDGRGLDWVELGVVYLLVSGPPDCLQRCRHKDIPEPVPAEEGEFRRHGQGSSRAGLPPPSAPSPAVLCSGAVVEKVLDGLGDATVEAGVGGPTPTGALGNNSCVNRPPKY